MEVVKSACLYFREQGSDKVYNATINKVDGGFTVNFAYGRRGNSLTEGSKTVKPVSEDEAGTIFGKLVNEKMKKGYKEDPNKSSSDITPVDLKDTGLRPQLLNDIDEDDLEMYLTDDEWCMQEKFDGRRRGLAKSVDAIIATNKQGLSTSANHAIISQFAKVTLKDKDIIFDGEDMGNVIQLFDILTHPGTYKQRYEALLKYDAIEPAMQVVNTAWTEKEKRQMLAFCKRSNAEGVVFKKVNALYKPGRPNSGGDQMKYKFRASASCIVTDISTKRRSVSIGVYEQGKLIPVGNVTIYPNQDVPAKGAVVEIEYLYYFPGGSLFQPVYKGERDDIDKIECVVEKLKAKRITVEDDD